MVQVVQAVLEVQVVQVEPLLAPQKEGEQNRAVQAVLEIQEVQAAQAVQAP